MTLVYSILTDTAGRPMQRQTARITLRGQGNPFTELSSEVVQTHAEDTNTSGIWVADLIPTSQYEAAGAWYHVDERDGVRMDGGVWDFRVPDDPNPSPVPTGVPAGAWWLRDLLITPPNPGGDFPAVPPHALGDHTDVDTTGEVVGRVLQFNGTKWVPAVVSGGGGGGSFFEMQQPLPVKVVQVPHNLGYHPAGVRLFTGTGAEVDEFAVSHVDANLLTVTLDVPFQGLVTVS